MNFKQTYHLPRPPSNFDFPSNQLIHFKKTYRIGSPSYLMKQMKSQPVSPHKKNQSKNQSTKHTCRERNQQKFTTQFFKNKNNYFENIKIQISKDLKKMNYREKLLNIQNLLKEAKRLSQKYGYFYITGANFFYDPNSQFKISLWIHPNIQSYKVMHPIKKKKAKEMQKQFYRSFKLALKQVFPTISFGNLLTYQNMIKHIQTLFQQLTKRFINLSSKNLVSILSSPRESFIHPNMKLKKISKLMDFDENEEIQQGNQQISMISEIHQNFWKRSSKDQIMNWQEYPMKTLNQCGETVQSIIKEDDSKSIVIKMQQEKEYTLANSKVNTDTSMPRKKRNNVWNELEKILNS